MSIDKWQQNKKAKRWEKVHANNNQKWAGVAIQMSEKNTLEDKNCYESQRTSYNDERLMYQDDITTINI